MDHSTAGETTRAVEGIAQLTDDADEAAALLPTQIGRYAIERKIGAGGMGEVFAALDPSLDRVVALKLVRPRRHEDTLEAGARLRREAQALARLSHPNVVPVFDVGAHANRIFVAMELVEGQTLRSWSQQHHRGWAEVLRVLADAGRGLAAAHHAGVVHRDFKPSNVMVGTDGRARVLDFGLARDLDARPSTDPGNSHGSLELSGDSLRSDALTEAGVVMGTPQYMAPEQFLDRELDARSDQFSFAVVAYRLLYGERPFAGTTYKQLRRNVLHGVLQAPGRGHGAPHPLWPVIRRGLARSPEDRFPDMDTLLAALERAKVRPRRWMAAGAAIAVMCTGGAVATAQGTATDPDCTAVHARASTVWGPTRQAAVRRAFTETDLPYAQTALDKVDEHLQRYVEHWATERVTACEAVLVAGPATPGLDHQIRCLRRGIDGVEALVGVFETGGRQVVDNATEAVRHLPAPAGCRHEGTAAGLAAAPDPQLATQLAALEADLDAVEADLLTGRATQALAPAHTAAGRATELGYGPVTSRAQRLLARAHRKAGDPESSRAAYETAVQASAASNDIPGEIEATIGLVGVLADRLVDPQVALQHVRQAEALMQRLDDPPSALRARLLRATGSAHLQAGDFEAAQSHLQQVLDIPGEDRSLSSTRASAREMLAVVLSRRGRYEESVEQFSIARDELETVLGPEHPRVAKILGNLGSSLRQLGRLDESEEAIRRAIEINTEINGPQAEGIATLLHNLGILQRSKGDEQAARQTLERSIELMVQHRGPDHPSVGWVRNDLGTLVFLGGDYERSLPHLREAARIFELSQGDQAPGLVFTMATLIQNHLALEQPNQALPYVERGLAALEQRTAEPAAAGSLRFACALALWDAGQRPRAVSLGRLALADMNSSQRPVETHIETIGAWVTEHEAQVH